MDGWVYIMTNKPNGTLYVGVRPRAWKIRLIIKDHPEWKDLYDLLLA